MYIHDTLKDITIYTLGETYKHDEDRSLRGLISGQNVCAGYAMIYKEMMDRQGIPCEYVEGNSCSLRTGEITGAHAWNILKLDGKNIPLDLTWAATAYRGAMAGMDFFGDVDMFIKTHRSWGIELIQNYSKTLSGLDDKFVRKVRHSIEVNRQTQRRLGVGKRADGSEFIISLIRRTANDNNPLFEYIYADLDKNGKTINPTILYAHNNIMNNIEESKRDNKKDTDKTEKIKNVSHMLVNELLSKKKYTRS